jgi:hypothetical protein
MQDVDRPAEIQPFPQPERARRPRMELKPLRLVLHPEGLDDIGGHCGWRRDIGKRSAVRAPEPERSVGLSIDLIALLVDRAVMPATEQGQVRERGGAAARPVAEVMALAEREPAAREATGPVSMVKGAPQGRGNRPRPGADLHEAPVLVVAHDHAAGVARQALGRFRGTPHVAIATPPGPETQYDRARRVQRSIALLVPESPSRNLTRGVARSPIVSPQRML